jgi:hypothetical protein
MRRVRSQFAGSVVRLSFVVVLVAMAMVSLSVGVASAAPKAGVATIGGPAVGTTGGLFNTPRGVAVNQSGAGGVAAGTFYVADFTNQRVQRFNPDGSFHSLWGQDVDATLVGTGFELCTAASGDVCKAGITTATTGGAFNGPQAMAVDQTDGSVYVGESANRRFQKFTADGTFVWAAGWDVVSTGLGNDATGTLNQFETCVAANGDVCKIAGAAGANAGQFGAQAPALAVNPINGEVVIADQTNRRVQRFSSAGGFVGAFGYDIVPTGQPGDTGTTALESCPASAAQVTGGCQAGATTNGGNNPGQFSTGQPTSIATDSSGVIYTVEASGNTRVQRFTPIGSSSLNFGASQFSPTAAPNRIAVDKSNDHIYVAKSSGGIAELDVLGNLVETHASTAALPAATGLDIRSATGTLYYAEATNHRLILLGTPIPPAATLDDVTTFTSTTATFTGTVNPTGLVAGYHFEYRPDSSPTFTKLPTSDADAGAVNSTNPVSQNATGLEPNTLYHVRLVATKIYGGGTTTTPEKTFTTGSVAPGVTGLAAYGIDYTTARLTGQVDPNSQAASYVFEYGTTPSLGSSTPVASVGSGASPVLVSRVVMGLDPDTTYHYRLVATNGTGSTPSPTKTFHTRLAPRQSNDRVYEQVSPIDKNVGQVVTVGAVTSDGQSVSYCNKSGFGDPPGEVTNLCSMYVSRRTGDGWNTTAPAWPRCKGGRGVEGGVAFPSPDLKRLVFRRVESSACTVAPLDPAAPLPSDNLYVTDLGDDSAAFHLLTPQPHIQLGPLAQGYIDGTDDFSHILYTSEGVQSPAAPVGAFTKIYDWHNGAIDLISRDTSNVPFTSASTVVSGRTAVNGVSPAGDRVFFYNGTVNTQELYLRKDGSVTRWVSEQECSPACPNTSAADGFEWATSDGSKALFMSAGKLTDDASFVAGQSNLYRYVDSASPSTDQNLVLIGKDNEPADGTNAGLLGVSGISSDGDTVFFAANGQIVPGAPTAAGQKVYRWRWNGGAPTVEYLATLGTMTGGGVDTPDTYIWRDPNEVSIERPGDGIVTPDGRRMIVQTVKRLDAATDDDSDLDVYRWDEADGWACLSCQTPGDPSSGASQLRGSVPSVYISAGSGLLRQRTVMVDNGERVFFMSNDALVPEDANGGRRDVYEWNDGTLSLVSSGAGESDDSPSDNVLIGVGASGDDAFFITNERLVGWDTDNSQDVYDARVGGGLPEPLVPPVGCDPDDDGCKGGGAGEIGVSPDSGQGRDGDAVAAPRGVLRMSRLSRAQRVALAYGTPVRIAFTVNRAGTLRLQGNARVGKRTRRVLSARRTVSNAQRIVVPLALSRPARLQLARTGRLRLRLAARFSNARGALTTSVLLKRRATATTTHRGR